MLVTPDILRRLALPSSGASSPPQQPEAAPPATPFRQAVQQLLLFFAETYRTVFGFAEGPPLHDPCAVAYVLAPHLFKVRW